MKWPSPLELSIDNCRTMRALPFVFALRSYWGWVFFSMCVIYLHYVGASFIRSCPLHQMYFFFYHSMRSDENMILFPYTRVCFGLIIFLFLFVDIFGFFSPNYLHCWILSNVKVVRKLVLISAEMISIGFDFRIFLYVIHFV